MVIINIIASVVKTKVRLPHIFEKKFQITNVRLSINVGPLVINSDLSLLNLRCFN